MNYRSLRPTIQRPKVERLTRQRLTRPTAMKNPRIRPKKEPAPEWLVWSYLGVMLVVFTVFLLTQL
jgi:hypothetical protein